ncbi:Late embryogenesis abundant protein [Trema orientale]|uniref:Late embryogenesis abundant protein n=1 Tax=Trema orientale TaxID=63057 RepID=A0A2P5ESV2_TREOI|nr:Late embryogenesis abundant protein [Trema orientale]
MEVASSSSPPPPAASKIGTSNTKAIPRPKRRRSLCIGTCAVILVIVTVIVILALTVFKPKRPVTTVDSVSLKDLNADLDIRRLRVDLNVTLDVDLSIKNPNKVGFKYRNSSAVLIYRGDQVGDVAIPGGEISADETKRVNVTLTLMADRLLSQSQVYSDVFAGALPLSTHTRVSGRVTILGIFKIHVVSTTWCDFTVNVSNRSVSDQSCTYKTKL